MILHLEPAYGRAYTNGIDLRHDWDEGKDFRIVGGPYASVGDMQFLRSAYTELHFYGGYVVPEPRMEGKYPRPLMIVQLTPRYIFPPQLKESPK